jgi:hypothetical protein
MTKVIVNPSISNPGCFEMQIFNPQCKYDKCIVYVVKGPPQGTHHGWDGNEESPTLTPSLNCSHRCGWHGYLDHGDLRQAPP